MNNPTRIYVQTTKNNIASLTLSFLQLIVSEIFHFKVQEISPTGVCSKSKYYFLEIGISYLTCSSISAVTPMIFMLKSCIQMLFKTVVKDTLTKLNINYFQLIKRLNDTKHIIVLQ